MTKEKPDNTIRLGGRSFPVPALTFDQLEALVGAFEDLKKPLNEGGLAAARHIIEAALSDQISPDDLSGLKTNLAEVMAAIPVISRASGLTELGERAAQTGATKSSNGATS